MACNYANFARCYEMRPNECMFPNLKNRNNRRLFKYSKKKIFILFLMNIKICELGE